MPTAPSTRLPRLPMLAIAASAGLLLGACGQSTEEKKTLFTDCMTVLSDAELQGELARASTTPDAACTCVQATLADDDDNREQVAYLLDRVATAMEETGAGADDAMSKLISGAMLNTADGDDPSMMTALPAFNAVFEETLDSMAENGGSCPAVG